ncbi:DUF4339 domain-containing protein, partial [bacterium]|nr:DUF4339 domain-containing protein [bacterium]
MTREQMPEKWWIANGQEHEGPFSTEDVRLQLRHEKLTPDRLICAVGGDTWKPLSTWTGLSEEHAESVVTELPPPPPIPIADSSEVEVLAAPKKVDVSSENVPAQVGGEDETDSPPIPVIAVLGLVGLVVCYFWFITVLWLLFGLSLVTGTVCVLLGAKEKQGKSARDGYLVGAGISGVVAVCFWFWIGSYNFSV